jgi:hypothetical protein
VLARFPGTALVMRQEAVAPGNAACHAGLAHQCSSLWCRRQNLITRFDSS